MSDTVKVLIWGFGAMGSGMARALLGKTGVEISGICDMHPQRRGKSMLEVLKMNSGGADSAGAGTGGSAGPGYPRDVVIRESIEEAMEDARDASIALLATDSFTRKAYEKIITLIEAGYNIISTAEEMAYPAAGEPELAGKIHENAAKAGVTVLGTGINPGLIMDLLVVMMTGACLDIDHIQAERVNSLSPFGPAVMEEQGVGLSPEEFRRGAQDGSLAGHVGFQESIGMIADALGWKLSAPIRQSMEAIVTGVPRRTEYASVEPGDVAGCRMEGHGEVDGVTRIEMLHPQQIEPEAEGIETGDYIRIKGTPNINLQIKPEVPGGIGTIAMCINMIPHVINASPGLKTMLDLPVPRAILGDMREMIHQ
ncbi:2,4-diaminopentanoate dehydrogenase [Salinispira pacifica]|uniref:2,4-diaminopentanoate dehydrogenase n=1 Tax=Salinispira pacifica TaxID=1307761 RepID=V5WGZ7_9SPIO|nr:2,4-diaminopentanoate dehydrogenase [Salinispira pacifica]AHC14441.1 2,4-diaminopentanoate dehydrogenase [Salinispira pacifica]